MKPPWGVWFWSLGSTHHGTFRDPVDAQQEQGSLDQRHPPRDALGLAAQQAIQAAGAAGNGSGAGFQLQDVRALVSLEDVDVWHDVFKLGIVILFGCTFPPTFVHVCAITRELCSLQPDGDSFAHRKWQESIPRRYPKKDWRWKVQGVNCSWFSATFSLLLGDLIWRRGPFQVTPLCRQGKRNQIETGGTPGAYACSIPETWSS